jgi:pimeloyl-ACP methyl ester carboxylesterase
LNLRHTFENGMFVRETGPAGATVTLLFIHGLGESGLCFEHLLGADELAAYRLLVPDLPGYGRSPWLAGEPLGLADQADHLAGWLRGRGEGPVILVGHSMGGVVALLLAERHAALARGVIDVDGNKSPDDCTFSGQAAGQDLATFRAGGFEKLRAAVHDLGRKRAAERGYHVSLCLADPRAYHRNSLELVEMSAREDLALRLAALPVPMVYVAGVPGGASLRSRQLLGEAGVTVMGISPAGHWPFIDRPEEFLHQMAVFLDFL